MKYVALQENIAMEKLLVTDNSGQQAKLIIASDVYDLEAQIKRDMPDNSGQLSRELAKYEECVSVEFSKLMNRWRDELEKRQKRQQLELYRIYAQN